MLKQLATIVSAGFIGTTAFAGVTYNFDAITSNGAGSVIIAEAQLAVEVIDNGGTVEFLFTNTGSEACVISEIYWDDNAGFSLVYDSMSTTTPAGVAFHTGSNPANLPAGNTVAFDSNFSVEADNPEPKWGIGPSEDLSVYFTYTGSYADLIAAMDSGELRVGIHVKSFENGQSESLITTTTTGVPTPTAALAGLAMLGAAGLRRRREA